MLVVLRLIALRIVNPQIFSILKILCERKIEKNRNFSVAFTMGILLRRSTHSTLSNDGYLKIIYLLKFFGLSKKGGGG